MKKLKFYILLLSFISLWGCNDSEKDLLKTKVYFEGQNVEIDVEGIDTYSFELTTRASKAVSSDIAISYNLGSEALVDNYNIKNGTKFTLMPEENIVFSDKEAVIEKGKVISTTSILELQNLSAIKEGDTYLVPILIDEAGLPVISESGTTFLIVKKPIEINKVYELNGNYLSVPLSTSIKFKSLTYEALIYADQFSWIKTVMGVEGALILRFGDTIVEPNMMQVAGLIQFGSSIQFKTKQWYHVAFTYDEVTKKGALYINGDKVADKITDVAEFNIHDQFFIGYAYDYDAARNWPGKMSECRLWTVARTENQIKQNMMGVDPNSDGLLGYWKLNGEDYFEENGVFYVKDQSKNKTNAVSRRGRYNGGAGSSIKPKVLDMKVNLKN